MVCIINLWNFLYCICEMISDQGRHTILWHCHLFEHVELLNFYLDVLLPMYQKFLASKQPLILIITFHSAFYRFMLVVKTNFQKNVPSASVEYQFYLQLLSAVLILMATGKPHDPWGRAPSSSSSIQSREITR